MNPLSKHIRTVTSVDMLAIADAVEAMANECADWQRVCSRLLPRIPRESLNVAERVILDVALEKLRAGGGAAGANPDGTAAVRCPPPARPDDDGIDVEERPMTAEEERLFAKDADVCAAC